MRKGKAKIVQIIKNLPVFYRSLIAMFCLVVVMVIGLYVNNQIFETRITENYLQLADSNLQQNFDTMCSAVYNTYAIPQAIENTSYFNYVRTEKSGYLPDKYISVLPLFRKALSNQVYLRGDAAECLLYFSGTNSIVTRFKVFQYSEDCFTEYIKLQEENVEQIFAKMNSRGIHELIALEQVSIGGITYDSCWAFIVKPYESSVALVSFYPISYVVDTLDIASFPEDTVLVIDSLSGERLATYPENADVTALEKNHKLSARSGKLNVALTLYIPEAYFTNQLQSVTNTSLTVTAVIFLVAIVLAFMISQLSTKPIQTLAREHGQELFLSRKSEEAVLEQVLTQNKQVQQELRDNLLTSLMARVFAGDIIPKAETAQLSEYVKVLQWPCQVAIIHADEEIATARICKIIRLVLGDNAVYQPISTNQVGVLLSSVHDSVTTLKAMVKQLLDEFPGSGIRCGVSSPVGHWEQVHIAVHQAKMAIPKEHGFEIYTVNNFDSRVTLSWLQHERLYQCIVNDEKESAVSLLQAISMEPYRGTAAREAFYNIIFVLRNASSQMDVPMPEFEILVYDKSKLPWENIQRLNNIILVLFGRIDEQKSRKRDDAKLRIVEYIKQNYADCNLCAATVAYEFMLSENRIYSIVREKTGMSFNEYLLSVRMERAGHLLCTTNVGTREIALQCGYQAESTFFRLFKRYFNMTPGEYRQQGGNEQNKQK